MIMHIILIVRPSHTHKKNHFIVCVVTGIVINASVDQGLKSLLYDCTLTV